MNNSEISEKILNKKTIHIELQGNVHRKFRALLFLKETNMQQFFRLMAEEFVNENPHLVKLVEEHVKNKKNKKVSELRSINQKELYDVIEENSPFNK